MAKKLYSFLSGERYFVLAESDTEALNLYGAILGDTDHDFTDDQIREADEGCEQVTLVERDDWQWEDLGTWETDAE